MKKKYLLASTPILIGIICLIISNGIGSRVDPDGTLVEPAFFLIPISYLFFFSGLIGILFMTITSKVKKNKHK